MKWLSDNVLKHLRELSGMPDPPGDRYHIGEELGRGDMAWFIARTMLNSSATLR